MSAAAAVGPSARAAWRPSASPSRARPVSSLRPRAAMPAPLRRRPSPGAAPSAAAPSPGASASAPPPRRGAPAGAFASESGYDPPAYRLSSRPPTAEPDDDGRDADAYALAAMVKNASGFAIMGGFFAFAAGLLTHAVVGGYFAPLLAASSAPPPSILPPPPRPPPLPAAGPVASLAGLASLFATAFLISRASSLAELEDRRISRLGAPLVASGVLGALGVAASAAGLGRELFPAMALALGPGGVLELAAGGSGIGGGQVLLEPLRVLPCLLTLCGHTLCLLSTTWSLLAVTRVARVWEADAQRFPEPSAPPLPSEFQSARARNPHRRL